MSTQQRPAILRPYVKGIPDTLRALDQWVCWRAKWNDERGKWDKVPINARTGEYASSTDKNTWSTFEEAVAGYDRSGGKLAGIGIVLCTDDPICGIDLDHAIENKQTCPVKPLEIDAQSIVDSIPTYWEVSPSGTGLRGFAIGTLPDGGNKRGDIEMYESGRFLTVTGRKFGKIGTIDACQAEVSALHAMVWPPQPPRERTSGGGTGLDGTDDELLQRAFTSATGAKIALLFGGSTVGYLGASEADLALCSLLAFWTGPDEARLDGLFRASRLMRDKWDEARGSETYGERTVRKAIASCTEFYKPAGSPRPPQPGSDVPPGGGNGGGGSAGAFGEGGGDRYRNSDTGNALRFVDQHGCNLRYDHDAKCWYVFDGRLWRKDGNGRAQERAKETIIALYAEAAKEPDEDRRKALASHAKASDKAQRITAMMALACSDPRVSVTAGIWDRDTYLLNVQNGTVNLRTGALNPHDQGDMITKICSVEFDPDATCPLWERCLERWQPDAEIRDFLRRSAGYSLTGDIGEETAFFLYGVGRNGKSKFTGALESIMGDYAARVNVEVLMDARRAGNATPDLIPLIGARLVIASELPEGRRINEAFVKDVTGGDKLTANPKYANIIQFRPQFKLWLYGNHKPTIKGTDDGIWSRLPLVPFTVTIPAAERDPKLDEKLLLEAPGILAWMVRGCQEWQAQRLSPPEAVIEATQEFREEMDTMTSFWEEYCVFAPGAVTANSVLREAYLKWCESEKTRNPLSAPQFGERLKQRGATAASVRYAGKAVRGWRGVSLKADNMGDDFAMTAPEIATVDAVDGANPDFANSAHVANIEKLPKNDVPPVDSVDSRSNSNTGNAFSVEKKEDKKVPSSSVATAEAGGDEDEDLTDPFADDPEGPAILTFAPVILGGHEQIRATLTGDYWEESGDGATEAEAEEELRRSISAPSDHEDLIPMKLAALEAALAIREGR